MDRGDAVGTALGAVFGHSGTAHDKGAPNEKGPTIICKNNGDCQNEIHSHNQLGASNDDMDAFLKHVTQHR